jgi:hypothetical protein
MDAYGQRRADLLARMSVLLGSEHAATLMESLHPRPWSELATKDDLVPIRDDIALLKSDVSVLRSDVAGLKTDVAVLKTDLTGLREDVNRRLDHLGETLELRFASQGDRLEALLRERIDAQTKVLVFSLMGAVLTAAGIAIGSAAL